MGNDFLRIAVLDDSARDRQTIVEYLDRFAFESDLHIETRTFRDGLELLEDYQPIYDVIFLDIEMGGLDGMRTAEQIRLVDSETIFVFVTNNGQYAISGYSVNALSFLLKPVKYFSFAQEMHRCVERIKQSENDSLVFGSGSVLNRVSLAEIVYVESISHRNVVHTFSQDYSYSGSLKNLEAELGGSGFSRCNNCYLINLRHVVGVDRDEAVMSSGVRLKISRPRKKQFMEDLTDHVGKRVR